MYTHVQCTTRCHFSYVYELDRSNSMVYTIMKM